MKLRLWDLRNGNLLRTFRGDNDNVNSIVVARDGRTALSRGHLSIRLWDIASGRLLWTFSGHTDRVEGLTLSADGRMAVSASRDMSVRLIDVASGREERALSYKFSCQPHEIAFSPDGRRFLVGGNGTVDLFEAMW